MNILTQRNQKFVFFAETGLMHGNIRFSRIIPSSIIGCVDPALKFGALAT
ncbi:Uncharacterised protein [uncultured archaeon]|nr:Uncharacterised protein [uncultured archaeon]